MNLLIINKYVTIIEMKIKILRRIKIKKMINRIKNL